MGPVRWPSNATIMTALAGVVLLVALAVALALPAAAAAKGIVLAVCGVVLLALPGALVAWSLRPTEGDLPKLELTVGAGAIALGLVAIGGLVLNLTPFGLNRWTWLGLVAAVLLSAWALAPDRMREPRRQRTLPILDVRSTVMLLAAALLVVTAVVIGRIGEEQDQEAFSQLWMVRPSDGGATVQIGLRNREGAATTFRLVVTVDGQPVQEWNAIELAAGGEWTVPLEASVPDGSVLVAELYRSSDPDTVYRQTVLYGPLPGNGPSG
jgi:uncharacterized membrane protein